MGCSRLRRVVVVASAPQLALLLPPLALLLQRQACAGEGGWREEEASCRAIAIGKLSPVSLLLLLRPPPISLRRRGCVAAAWARERAAAGCTTIASRAQQRTAGMASASKVQDECWRAAVSDLGARWKAARAREARARTAPLPAPPHRRCRCRCGSLRAR